jgi:hypothetical protein
MPCVVSVSGGTLRSAMPLARFPLIVAFFALAIPALLAQERPDPEPFVGHLSLVRYDMPRGLSNGYAPTRQLAQRKDGSDAVDWPDLTLNGQPVFRGGAEESRPLTLRKGADAKPLFQARTDDVIQPGNHWLRATEWRLGRRHIYTADSTARTANAGEAMSGRYELWTFPVQIKGEGGPVVRNVALKVGGATIYRKPGPWRSLTLLLPASEAGKPYELTVDGRPPVRFNVGLMPVKLGTPHERTHAVDVTLAGEGPKIRVQTLARPEEFPNPKEWAADLAALRQAQPGPSLGEDGGAPGIARHLGVEVPRSPLTIYATQLPHGMSGGFYRQRPIGFAGTPEEYAAHLAAMGFDAVFDQADALPAPSEKESFERRAAALARAGVKLGLQYDNNWTRPSLQHPNLGIFAHALPEWHAPLYRSLSLAAQRFGRLRNFLGINIGSDNAGYVSYWHWAPPIPDRPWGEAMIAFMGSAQPALPRGPSLGSRELPIEFPVKETAEFVKHVSRYDASFQQYGYFAEALREVDKALVFTTGSFGSSPGVGGRGGWPWASVPGRVMFEGLNVQQAYDWNELRAAKPMHNAALVDRLRSYAPRRTTWALLDNFKFLYGREAYQRACAIALTRGIQGLGTNFLAKPSGDGAQPETVAFQKEMHEWIRRFGGVYAHSEPVPVIGIFYGHHQAVQRRVVTEEDAPEEKLFSGSHEGKVTEALFLCHAAGWPARVITYQEVRREPLPDSMKAILLVGLNQADTSWHWAPGLEPELQRFLDRGGRILADEESFSPIPCTKTGMRVAAYQPQSNLDPTPLLLARNRDNIQKLRAAMEGINPPIAASDDPTLWAIPTRCGDTDYVTAINQAVVEGQEAKEMLRPADPRASKAEVWKTKGNASLHVPPRRGTLAWNTDRPVYDVRLGRKVSREEAAEVDLTRDGFRWYAVPPAEVTAPMLKVERGASGFYEATVAIGNPRPMRGIPVRLTVSRGNEAAEVFAASGFGARLPLSSADAAGDYTVTATELLTGLSSAISVTIEPPSQARALSSAVQVRDAATVSRFAARRNVALAIALAPEQEMDAKLVAQARVLEGYYRSRGRIVSLGTVKPGGVVESLQPLKTPHRYPQWKTIPADLVLFGTPANNVLILDQARAHVFPLDFQIPPAGFADVLCTRSAFVGEYDVLNVIAADAAGIEAAVKTITAQPRSPAK